MHLPLSLLALVSLLLTPSRVSAAADLPKSTNKPCTLHSPSTGSFYDLRPLQVLPSTAKDARNDSWHAKGYDYGANFTLNICGPVVEHLEDVNDVSERSWRNVSAFYTTAKNEVYSIGQQSADPIFRGKKLVLNYTSGSLCPELDENGRPRFATRKILDGDEDDDELPPSGKPSKGKAPSPKPLASTRRKSTLLSFQCDRDPQLTDHPQISFIGSPDHCTYFFEVRSRYACGGAISSGESGSLGPGGVFGVILAITVLVYLIGGCVYQRSVMHQRGWRQCPNYGVWAGLFGFIGVSHIPNLFFLPSFPLRSRRETLVNRSSSGVSGIGESVD
jgi:cation-dependent mannose-6-phosphate receptor